VSPSSSHTVAPIDAFKALCPHCGNVTYQREVTSEGKYRTYACDMCGDTTFQKVNIIQVERTTPRGKKVFVEQEQLEQLWPILSVLPNEVPERGRKIYEEAISIRTKSPSSFVVQIRRALEAVANERKAPSGSLYNQVEWLIKNNLLPETFGKMAQITRLIGNLGAHDADMDVRLEDTEVVDEFFRAAIEYIYIAPAKIVKLNDLLKAAGKVRQTS
jgi:predicted RNA-binding Zn-ribbon protein involved in translation (DUF1610 family)